MHPKCNILLRAGRPAIKALTPHPTDHSITLVTIVLPELAGESDEAASLECTQVGAGGSVCGSRLVPMRLRSGYSKSSNPFRRDQHQQERGGWRRHYHSRLAPLG